MKRIHLPNICKMTMPCLAVCLVMVTIGCAPSKSEPTPAADPQIMTQDIIIAEGHLLPKTSTWLSFQTTGRVESILVEEGDEVEKGQPLVRLEGSDRAESELEAAQSALFLALQNLNDAKNSGAMKGAAELELAEAQRAYNRALFNYNSHLKSQGSLEEIELYKAKVIIAQDKVDELQEDLNSMSEKADDDVLKAEVIAKLNMAKMELDDIKDNYQYYKDPPDDIDVDRLLAELDIAEARVEDAQRDLDRLKDGPGQESLAALQAAADQAQAAADNAQWAYDQLVLTAPYAGEFVECKLTVGEFVTAGQKVALVADFSQWQVETTDLDEMEVTRIDLSKPVAMTADAVADKKYNGTLDKISEYFIDDNGDVLYTASVNLSDYDGQLRWGMTMQLIFKTK